MARYAVSYWVKSPFCDILLHYRLIFDFFLILDWTYFEVLLEEYKPEHASHQIFCVYWKKILEWRQSSGKYLDSYYKTSTTYMGIRDVSLKILSCTNKINVHITDKKGNTPLILFSALNECSIMKILIEKGADVNRVGENGWNALHALYASLGMWEIQI